MSALRLLGWRDPTHAVAVAYRAGPPNDAPPDVTDYNRVSGIRLLLLGPDAATMVTDVPGTALSVDVASDALSTPGSASHAPILPMRPGWAAALALIG